MAKLWTQGEALDLAINLEPVAAKNNVHIGLTGGLLYKPGPRKDCDFVVYRHNSEETWGKPIERIGFENDLLRQWHTDWAFVSTHPRVTKMTYRGKSVDFIYCELLGAYNTQETASIFEEPCDAIPF